MLNSQDRLVARAESGLANLAQLLQAYTLEYSKDTRIYIPDFLHLVQLWQSDSNRSDVVGICLTASHQQFTAFMFPIRELTTGLL